MSNTTFVIAGCYKEYALFLDREGFPEPHIYHRLPRQPYTFISDPLRLYGVVNATVLCIGGYEKSPVFTYRKKRWERISPNIKFITESGERL